MVFGNTYKSFYFLMRVFMFGFTYKCFLITFLWILFVIWVNGIFKVFGKDIFFSQEGQFISLYCLKKCWFIFELNMYCFVKIDFLSYPLCIIVIYIGHPPFYEEVALYLVQRIPFDWKPLTLCEEIPSTLPCYLTLHVHN